jgi:hypothetical protein
MKVCGMCDGLLGSVDVGGWWCVVELTYVTDISQKKQYEPTK